MHRLTEIIEQLASAVVIADASEPYTLKALQSHFLALTAVVEQLHDFNEPAFSDLHQIAMKNVELIEKLIGGKVSSAKGSLQALNASVVHIQQLISNALEHNTDAGAVPLRRQDLLQQPSTIIDGEGHPLVAQPENAISVEDLPLVADLVAEVRGHIEGAEVEILRLDENSKDSEAINAIFRSFHSIKGAAACLNLRQITTLAHAAESLLDQVREGRQSWTSVMADLVLEVIDVMKLLNKNLDEAARSNTSIAQHPRLPNLLQHLYACASSPEIDNPGIMQVEHQGKSLVGAADNPARNLSTIAAPLPRDGSVRVATERLDTLVNLVGEMVVAQSMVAHHVMSHSGADQPLVRDMMRLTKITRELRDLSMSMRMVPLRGVFRRMARLVRDLTHTVEKEAEFVAIGDDTELDRDLIEAISDPLMHLIRNAVDHGIEAPDVRVRAGKPRTGRIELRARHQAGGIVIEVVDDGQGLDRQRIRQKAIDTGLVTEKQNLSDAEIFQLIFHAGLSTAEKITAVSGRGVGMDVVRKNVEALRGRIELTSAEGVGSTISMRLPLTLAVIEGLLVRVASQRYVIPLNSVEQSIRPEADQMSTVQCRGEVCLVRGMLIPLFRLADLFEAVAATEHANRPLVVIVEDNGRRCGLIVDELLGQQQMVIKSLGDGIGTVPGVSGGAVLGDGNVSLILDVPGLIDLAFSNRSNIREELRL